MTAAAASLPASAWRRWSERQHARWLTEHWRVGLIDAPLASLLAPDRPVPPIAWLTDPERGGYWADPFAFAGDPETIYAERFDERSGLGRIERLRLVDGRIERLGPIGVGGTGEIEGAHGVPMPPGDGSHTSFPHVFELDGERLAVAETAAARRCVLHRVDAAGRWHSPLTLVPDRSLADPAVFRWQQRYWLAATDTELGAHDNLCLFHAERLDGPWTPHATYPVRRDRGGARMAGRFFEHEGVLYRPGQDCRASYGAAVVLYRVDACTPSAYAETEVRRIEPDRHGPLPHGLHTLTAWGDRTLVDGKRHLLNPSTLRRKLMARLTRASRPARRGGC